MAKASNGYNGRGYAVAIEGEEMVIRLPVKAVRPSKSGKMQLFFSSGGFDWNSVPGYGINLTVGQSTR